MNAKSVQYSRMPTKTAINSHGSAIRTRGFLESQSGSIEADQIKLELTLSRSLARDFSYLLIAESHLTPRIPTDIHPAEEHALLPL